MKTVFVEEAAALLGVSRRTVYYRIQSGELATIRTLNGTTRVSLESIEALLRRKRVCDQDDSDADKPRVGRARAI